MYEKNSSRTSQKNRGIDYLYISGSLNSNINIEKIKKNWYNNWVTFKKFNSEEKIEKI